MNNMFKIIKRGMKNPRGAVEKAFHRMVNRLSKKYVWSEGKTGSPADPAVMKRKYDTYGEYLAHQKSKLRKINSYLRGEYDVHYRTALRERVQKHNVIVPGMSVLCLAARVGTEVKAFLDIGCFAVGVDINPGKGNKYVVYGDFHDIQFPDHCVDAVFTNSLDHAFDLDTLIKEVKRVLKQPGILVLEIVRGTEEGSLPGQYESICWKESNDVLSIFLKAGFVLIKKVHFEYPWSGQHISLALEGVPGST